MFTNRLIIWSNTNTIKGSSTVGPEQPVAEFRQNQNSAWLEGADWWSKADLQLSQWSVANDEISIWACRCACALVVFKFHLCLDSISENVIKLPDHGTVRKPEWGEWFTAESVTTVCGFTLISQNRGLYGTQGEVSSAGVYQRKIVPSFIFIWFICLLLTVDDSNSWCEGCWTGIHWNRSPSYYRKPDPHSDRQPLCEVQSMQTH